MRASTLVETSKRRPNEAKRSGRSEAEFLTGEQTGKNRENLFFFCRKLANLEPEQKMARKWFIPHFVANSMCTCLLGVGGNFAPRTPRGGTKCSADLTFLTIFDFGCRV